MPRPKNRRPCCPKSFQREKRTRTKLVQPVIAVVRLAVVATFTPEQISKLYPPTKAVMVSRARKAHDIAALKASIGK